MSATIASLQPGDTIIGDDPAHRRSIEINLDDFDGVYRVVIKHDPENHSLWYYFDFETLQTLHRFLEQKGFDSLKLTEDECWEVGLKARNTQMPSDKK